MSIIKIGLGEDSHAFVKNKALILGGETITQRYGFLANSDGDVISHALCNACEIVMQQGSLANYTDALCKKGIKDSFEYVKFVLKEVNKQGYGLTSLSISLEALKPKLEKHLIRIKKNLANICKIRVENIGLTVTSGEGLTAFGQGLGIRALVLAVFTKLEE